MLAASLLALLVQAPAAAAAAPAPAASARAVIERASGPVETSTDGVVWQAARAGRGLEPGGLLRTGASGRTTLEAPRMRLVLGPSGRLKLAGSFVLEAGRLELSGPGAVLSTARGSLAGSGSAIVSVAGATVVVSVLQGEFRIHAGGEPLALVAGRGTVLREGSSVEGPLTLPASAAVVEPGADPVYVRRGQPVALRWSPAPGPHRVIVETRLGGEVVHELLTEASPVSVTLDAPGLYRWRVVAVDPRGLEAAPSSDGGICVVER